MKKFIVLILSGLAVGLALVYLLPRPHSTALKMHPNAKKSAPTLSWENFEPTQRPTRNSGSWVKRGGTVTADRVSYPQTGTFLRIRYDVREDKEKYKEAGWWCSLAGMNLNGYESLRFRVALSNPHIQFLIGFKSGDWLEQKISSASCVNGSLSPGQWQDITVPLHAFTKIDNWSGMDNFSITFRSDVSQVPKAEIFFDDFVLIAGGKPYVMTPPPPPLMAYPLPPNPEALPDPQLLDLVEHAALNYFVEETDSTTGLVRDFCRVGKRDNLPVASSAATGFGIASLCVGASRGWVSDDFAKGTILKALKFYRDEAQQEHGFFYHFLDIETGKRWEESELSSIDTTLLLAGMLTAANYYPGTEIEKIAREIYARVDWDWMMAGGKTLSMGWTPESGFLNSRWVDYCESMILYLLAIGSPTHPIPANAWYQWSRMRHEYEGENFIACPPLFTHQYSHIWIDFRGIKDDESNYFENSVRATRANLKWCRKFQEQFRTYREGFWGLTASDGPTGYMAYGAPYGVDDGTVAPTAAIGSIVFTPTESIELIRLMLKKMPGQVWGQYGFIDAFNLENNWFSKKYIGIDEGPIVLMIENYRTGLVWRTFMRESAIQKALGLVKFVKDETPPKK